MGGSDRKGGEKMDIIERSIIAELYQAQGKPLGWSKLVHEVKTNYFRNPKDGKLFDLIRSGEYDITKLSKLSSLSLSQVVDAISRDAGMVGYDGVLDFIEKGKERIVINILKSGKSRQEIANEIISLDRTEDKKDVWNEYLDYSANSRKRLAKNGLLGVSTGWEDLDTYNLGFPTNRIWVVGGYSGSGKTYFMLNMIYNLILDGGRCAIFSLEMTTNQIVDRLIQIGAGLTPPEVHLELKGEVAKRKENAIAIIESAITDKDLLIFDDISSAEQIYNTTRGITGHIDCVAVDYIQLITGNGDNYDTLREGIFTLQRMTKELNTSALVLSQISNETHKQGDGSQVFGFKGSGDIGQTADLAIRIMRSSENGKILPDFRMVIVKNRHGAVGELDYIIKFPGGRIENKQGAS